MWGLLGGRIFGVGWAGLRSKERVLTESRILLELGEMILCSTVRCLVFWTLLRHAEAISALMYTFTICTVLSGIVRGSRRSVYLSSYHTARDAGKTAPVIVAEGVTDAGQGCESAGDLRCRVDVVSARGLMTPVAPVVRSSM